MSRLAGERVLVIGAAGFIGGRLTERLLFEEGARVRAFVRNYASSSYLGRFDVEIVQGSVADRRAVAAACEGCSVVVNCSYSSKGILEADLAVNAEGVINVLDGAMGAGARRVVHISTVSVMGPNPPEGADETYPCSPTGEMYGDTKLAGERRAIEHHERTGSPIVVVRPTVVYGPRAASWTVGPISRIRSGEQLLIGRNGICNPVFVDNLVDGLLLAMTVEGIDGQTYIISDGIAVPWRTFLGYYVDWTGGTLRTRSHITAQALACAVRAWEKTARVVVNRVFAKEDEKLRRGAVSYSRQLLFPGVEREAVWVKFFASGARLSIEKARRDLGYEPRFSIDEGMTITREWARIQGLI